LDGERVYLRKLNKLEVRKKYQIEIPNNFAALENLAMTRIYIGLGRTLKTVSKHQLNRV